MKTLTTLRAEGHALYSRVIQKIYDLCGITVSEKEPVQSCELCQGPMRVQKTVRHEGRTMAHGTFHVNETIWVCADKCHHPSGKLATRRSNSVSQCIMPNSIVGYDLMVFVGCRRYLDHWQREDIRTELREKHAIEISCGEVTRLEKCFLDYLVRLHRSRAEQIKTALHKEGGWPMHVDATGEHGRGTLLLVMAGWNKWVLGSWKIATEHSELILPCLRDIVEHFGSPCAAMRDMGRGITLAIDQLVLEMGVTMPVLVCHEHFLADIGKDLLEPPHSELRGLFRRTKVRPKIRSLIRELGRKIGEQIGEARKAVQQWQSMVAANHRIPEGQNGLAVVRSMAQWTLDYNADATGLDFPFDRPYLDFYNRCLITLRAIDAFLRIPPNDPKVVSAAKRLHRILAVVSSEVPFFQAVRRLRRRAKLFDKLRGKLRLASKLPENDSEDDLNIMRENFDEWIDSIRKRRPERGPSEDIRNAIDTILTHVDKHGNNLWGHIIPLPEYAGGGIRLVGRTNELAENFFQKMKHLERRRSGRKNLTQDLEHLPSAAALAYNLKDPEYVRIVCGSLDKLSHIFFQMDQEEQQKRKKGFAPMESEDLERVLQLSTSSLSTADRSIVRTDAMNKRIKQAAKSRAPRLMIEA